MPVWYCCHHPHHGRSSAAVPDSFREGSLGLGATKWQTVTSVVLPAAIPGIVTGIVLSVGRIISEKLFFGLHLVAATAFLRIYYPQENVGIARLHARHGNESL